MTANASGWDENQLLRNHWLMSMDYNPKKWNGCNSIKAKYNLKIYKSKHEQLRNDIRDYVNLLKDCCTVYCDIINPKREGAFSRIYNDDAAKKSIVELTVKILRIGAVASFVPILFAIRVKFPDNHKAYSDYLELCEKFAFRVYRYSGKRSNTGQTTLYKFGYELYKDIANAQETFDKLRSLLLYYASNKEFEEETKCIDEDWYNWYGVKYLLYEYELYCAGKNPVLMDWVYLQKKDKQDSIEHILPQTPDKPYWTSRWTKDQIIEATHDIGNLVLTLDNSVYSNHGFDIKKGKPEKAGCYSNSSLFSERELNGFDEWTYEAFLKRREKIVAWIIQRWNVDYGKLLNIQLEEDYDPDDIADEVKEIL
jgi:hypothetical protein